MANHIKPTKAELKAKADKALKDAEELENNPTPSPSQPVPTASPSPSTAPSASPSPSEAPSASPSPSSSAPSSSPSPSAPDDEELEKQKKKAAASAREALLIRSRNKKYDAAVEEAEGIQAPTDEEMHIKYGKDEWDDLPEVQKQIARDAWVSNKRFEVMSSVSKEGKEIQAWLTKVDKFITDPKTLNSHPELEGKQEEFKQFVAIESRRGLDFEDLLLAFAGYESKNPKNKNKGQMFEKGSPGRKDKPKPNDGKISAAAGRALRKTDYKKWKEMLKGKKIREE